MPIACMTAWRLKIVAASALTALPLLAEPAHALPAGGTVVGGKVTIGQPDDGKLTIDQTSNRGAIDWRSFSIEQGERVRFNLPDAGAISFNRVTGPDPSKIMGNLSSNGQVWLMNPNGVLFGSTARVDTSGLVASTASMTPSAFMAGGTNFSLSGRADATVVNEGRITIANRGLAAFVAPGVRNAGIIQAQLGKVALASGDRYTLDLYGDGLVKLAVTDKIADKLVDADGKPMTARVENTGTIKADGGSVLLTTTAATQVVDSLINVSGTIQARTASAQGGRIVLQGEGGTVAVSGSLDAAGATERRKGGNVQVLGERVVLDSTARIDVSGGAGGGTALIGGDVPPALGTDRPATVPTAKRTVVATGATIKADATNKGKGGKVVVRSEEDTRFGGTISANGGKVSGNGGSAMVAGGRLQYAGSVSLAAASGNAGTLSLGATDIRVTADPAGAAAGVVVNAGDAGAAPAETLINVADLKGKQLALDATKDVSIDAAIETGGVSLNAGRDINLNAALKASSKIGLSSGRDTRVGAPIETASLTMNAGGSITGDGIVSVTGKTRLDAQRVSLTGGSASGTGTGNKLRGPLDIFSPAGVVLWNATDTVLRNIEIGGTFALTQTAGNVTQIAPTRFLDSVPARRGIFVGRQLLIDARNSDSSVILFNRNEVGSLSVFAGRNLAFNSLTRLKLDTIEVGRHMILNGSAAAGTGSIDIRQTGPVRVSGNTLISGDLGKISLNNSANSFGGTLTLTPTADRGTPDVSVDIAAAGNLDLAVTTQTQDLTAKAAGNLTLTGIDTGALSATAGGLLTFAGVTAQSLTATAGSIAQTAALPLSVHGNADLTATAGAIQLAEASNRFGGQDEGGTLTLNGPSVTLGGRVVGNVVIGSMQPQEQPQGSVTLGELITRASDANRQLRGDLTIRAKSVNQTNAVSIQGKTNITAETAFLGKPENDFIGRVSLTATNSPFPTFAQFVIADRNALAFDSVSATRLKVIGAGTRQVSFGQPIKMARGILEITGFTRINLEGGSIGQALGGGLAVLANDAEPLFIGGQETMGSFPFQSNPLAELTGASGLLAAYAATASDDFVRRIGKGEVSQTPAENAISYRPEYEGYASNPFTPRYDLLGFDRGDPRAASFARNTPYVLDGFWEGLLR